MDIFLSGPFRDLMAERASALTEIDRLGHAVCMERFGARPYPPLEVCLSEVGSCRVVLLLLGSRYGTPYPGTGRSYTEEEIRSAMERDALVLAFLKTQGGEWVNAEADEDRRAKLNVLVDLVRRSVVWQQFEEPSELPLLISHAWQAAVAREGDLGLRGRTLIKTTSQFRGLLDSHRTFNHATPLVGRQQLVANIVEAAGRSSTLVLLEGRGGAGKTRVLLEAANVLEQRGVAVRWVKDGVRVLADVARELPAGRVVLFCDDAHRQDDLVALLNLIRFRDDVVIVAGLRPWGADAVRVAASRAGVAHEQIADLGSLADLSLEELVQLVRPELGEYGHLAEPLVEIAADSPLVALVAARLLRKRQVHPNLLANDLEFRYAVLQRFQDEALGQVSDAVEKSLARNALRLVATLQRFRAGIEDEVRAAAEFLGCEQPALRLCIGELERAGVVRVEQGSVRIVPDVLADSILADACYDRYGRPSGYEQSVLEQFGDDALVRVVQATAELDWRVKARGGTPNVFKSVWSSFIDRFWAVASYERARLLRVLKRVAMLQPETVLALAEEVIARETGDPDSEHVLHVVPEVAAVAAHHESTFGRAIELLWRLGRDDRRELNQHPEHAIRMLGDVVGYYPGRAVWRQQLAVETLVRWCGEQGWISGARDPLCVAEAILATEVIKQDWRGEQLVMTRVAVLPTVTMPMRVRTLGLLGSLVLADNPKGRIAALKCLIHKGLARPGSHFGHEVTVDEEMSWLPQYRAALGQLRSIAMESNDPLVLMVESDELKRVARTSRLEEVRSQATAIRRTIRESGAIRLTRAVGQRFPDALGRKYGPGADKLTQRTTGRVAEDLVRSCGDGAALLGVIGPVVDAYLVTGEHPEPGPLLHRFAGLNPAIAISAADLVCNEERRFAWWLPYLLGPLRASRRDDYVRLLRGSAASPDPGVRRAAGTTLWFVGFDDSFEEEEKAVLEGLLQDPDASVRAAAVMALSGSAVERTMALELADKTLIGSSIDVAANLAYLWPRGEPIGLGEEAAATLLRSLVDIRDLGSRGHYHTDDMLVGLAKEAPIAAVELLIERVKREAAWYAREEPGDSYDAIPYDGFVELWEALRESGQYASVVRTLVEAVRVTNDAFERSLLADLFHKAVGWSAEVEAAISEWVDKDGCEAILAISDGIKLLPRTLVLESVRFVESLLEVARDCQEHVKGRFLDSLAKTVIGFGIVHDRLQDDPVLVRVCDEAPRIARELPDTSPARAFYLELSEKAATWLARARSERALGPRTRQSSEEEDWD